VQNFIEKISRNANCLPDKIREGLSATLFALWDSILFPGRQIGAVKSSSSSQPVIKLEVPKLGKLSPEDRAYLNAYFATKTLDSVDEMRLRIDNSANPETEDLGIQQLEAIKSEYEARLDSRSKRFSDIYMLVSAFFADPAALELDINKENRPRIFKMHSLAMRPDSNGARKIIEMIDEWIAADKKKSIPPAPPMQPPASNKVVSSAPLPGSFDLKLCHSLFRLANPFKVNIPPITSTTLFDRVPAARQCLQEVGKDISTYFSWLHDREVRCPFQITAIKKFEVFLKNQNDLTSDDVLECINNLGYLKAYLPEQEIDKLQRCLYLLRDHIEVQEFISMADKYNGEYKHRAESKNMLAALQIVRGIRDDACRGKFVTEKTLDKFANIAALLVDVPSENCPYIDSQILDIFETFKHRLTPQPPVSQNSITFPPIPPLSSPPIPSSLSTSSISSSIVNAPSPSSKTTQAAFPSIKIPDKLLPELRKVNWSPATAVDPRSVNRTYKPPYITSSCISNLIVKDLDFEGDMLRHIENCLLALQWQSLEGKECKQITEFLALLSEFRMRFIGGECLAPNDPNFLRMEGLYRELKENAKNDSNKRSILTVLEPMERFVMDRFRPNIVSKKNELAAFADDYADSLTSNSSQIPSWGSLMPPTPNNETPSHFRQKNGLYPSLAISAVIASHPNLRSKPAGEKLNLRSAPEGEKLKKLIDTMVDKLEKGIPVSSEDRKQYSKLTATARQNISRFLPATASRTEAQARDAFLKSLSEVDYFVFAASKIALLSKLKTIAEQG
jgi:hypothetical protein